MVWYDSVACNQFGPASSVFVSFTVRWNFFEHDSCNKRFASLGGGMQSHGGTSSFRCGYSFCLESIFSLVTVFKWHAMGQKGRLQSFSLSHSWIKVIFTIEHPLRLLSSFFTLYSSWSDLFYHIKSDENQHHSHAWGAWLLRASKRHWSMLRVVCSIYNPVVQG